MRWPIGTRLVAAAALVAATLAVSDWAWPTPTTGLRAVVRQDDLAGPILGTLDDSTQDVLDLAQRVSWPPGQPFAVEWTGWVEAPQPGRYRFHATVDDGAAVAIDGRDIVAVEGPPGIYDRDGEVDLAGGWHRLRIRYVQQQGDARFVFRWMAPGGPREFASPRLAGPGRGWPGDVSPAAQQRARMVVALAWAAAIALALLAALARWLAPWSTWRLILRAGGAPLWGALLVSLALIVVHITWGAAPLRAWYPDELTPADVLGGLEQRFSGGWSFLYPPLQFYLTALVLSPLSLADRLGLLSLTSPDLLSAYHVGERLISTAMAGAILLVSAAIGRETIGVRRAVPAIWLIGTAQLFVFYARTAHVDLPYTLWIAVSLLFFLRALRTRAVADHASLGLAAAFAVGTKDQAFGYFVGPALTLLCHAWLATAGRPVAGRAWRTLLDPPLLAGAATSLVALGLVFGLPWNLAGFRAHIDHVTGWRMGYFRMFDAGPAGQAQLALLTLRLLPWAFGSVAVVAAAAGIVVAARRRRFHRLLWLALPPVSYYVCSLMPIGYVYDRFLLGWAVPVGLFGALGLWQAARAMAWRRPAASLAVAAALVAAMMPAMWLDVEFARHTRGRVEHWLSANVPAGGLVLAVGSPAYLPALSPYRHVILDQADDGVAGWRADVMVVNEAWLLRFDRPRSATVAVLEAAGFHEVRREPAPSRPAWLAMASGPPPPPFATNLTKVSQPFSLWTRGEMTGVAP